MALSYSFPRIIEWLIFRTAAASCKPWLACARGDNLGGLGVWLKARPGFQRYSLTANDFVNFPPANFPSIFHFALDLGGVLEFSVSRRTALRFDASDVMRFHREKTLEGLSFRIPAARYDTIQFSTAWVWRF